VTSCTCFLVGGVFSSSLLKVLLAVMLLMLKLACFCKLSVMGFE
jgi:hypothetical protein